MKLTDEELFILNAQARGATEEQARKIIEAVNRANAESGGIRLSWYQMLYAVFPPEDLLEKAKRLGLTDEPD